MVQNHRLVLGQECMRASRSGRAPPGAVMVERQRLSIEKRCVRRHEDDRTRGGYKLVRHQQVMVLLLGVRNRIGTEHGTRWWVNGVR